MGSIVEARVLTKKFRDVIAVAGIDFFIESQACFGFLGPNGAGKTTTVRMVSCFMPPTSGDLRVLGWDVRQHPRRIKASLGVCPQENNLDPDLTVFDNLRVFARYFDLVGPAALRRCEELLEFVGLRNKHDSAVDELSGGMKRRLIIGRSLINKPKLLILDEPTTGLDPQARHQIWETIAQLRREGTTVLLTTHYMDEAEHLCDEIVIMDQGRFVAQGRPRELISRHIGSNIIEIASSDPSLEGYLKTRGLTFERTAAHYYLYVKEGQKEFGEIAARVGEGACILRMANLEDVFLKVTGRELRE